MSIIKLAVGDRVTNKIDPDRGPGTVTRIYEHKSLTIQNWADVLWDVLATEPYGSSSSCDVEILEWV